jgi:hypothetical protein
MLAEIRKGRTMELNIVLREISPEQFSALTYFELTNKLIDNC